MIDNRLYLIHILECIGRIDMYVTDCNREVFMGSPLIQDAVLRNLQVMAESIQRLTDDMKAAHPEIEWLKISGFRNLLAHDYLGVDIARIWLIIERDLPDLKNAVQAMLQELG